MDGEQLEFNFYSNIIGWRPSPVNPENGNYEVLLVKENSFPAETCKSNKHLTFVIAEIFDSPTYGKCDWRCYYSLSKKMICNNVHDSGNCPTKEKAKVEVRRTLENYGVIF